MQRSRSRKKRNDQRYASISGIATTTERVREREKGEKSCKEKKARKKERKEGRKREALGLEAGRLHLFISSSTAQMPVLAINSPQPLAFHPRV